MHRPKDPTFVQLSRPALRKFRAARMQRPHLAAIHMKLDDWSFLSKWRRKWQLDQKRGAGATLGLDVDVALQSADAAVDVHLGDVAFARREKSIALFTSMR